MLTAIDLNHQLCGGSKEIDNIRPQRFLTMELEPEELLAPQVRPQQLLGLGHLFAQCTGWPF